MSAAIAMLDDIFLRIITILFNFHDKDVIPFLRMTSGFKFSCLVIAFAFVSGFYE